MKPGPKDNMKHLRFGWAAFASRQEGSALLSAAMFCAIASLLLGSVLMWTGNHGRLVNRQNEYQKAQYVAEAGAETIFAALRSNMVATGTAPNQSFLDGISTTKIPTSADDAVFASYRFVTSGGVSNKIAVTTAGTAAIAQLTSGTYAGLSAIATPYRIVSRVNSFNRPVRLTTGVQRDIAINYIPLFQFAVFYNLDMEIEPGPAMTISGKVHTNGDAYIAPDSSLTFQDTLTVQQDLNSGTVPGDTHKSSWADPIYNSTVTTGVSPLNLPIPTATNPHTLIEPPPASGPDPIASQRLYNQAGLRIRVANSGITVTDGSGTAVSGVTVASGIISTNKTMYNYREGNTTAITEIDISRLISLSKVPANGIVYVDDTRTVQADASVRLVNGSTLPAGGMSVVTPNPIYIQGNYNSTADAPSAIFADAVNILSGSWSDSNSNKGLSSRVASSTTINAALFTGIVPTAGNNYSGGLENLTRFHEDWSSKTFTYKGSMIVMFASQTATGIWGNSSYGAPTRAWSFDTQFLNPNTLPPGCPSVRTISRNGWAAVN